MSKLSIFYAMVAAVIVGWYSYATVNGEEPLVTPSKEKTTQEARRGGYRGGHMFIFVHTGGGFRGK
jgi:hypothetical protein